MPKSRFTEAQSIGMIKNRMLECRRLPASRAHGWRGNWTRWSGSMKSRAELCPITAPSSPGVYPEMSERN